MVQQGLDEEHYDYESCGISKVRGEASQEAATQERPPTATAHPADVLALEQGATEAPAQREHRGTDDSQGTTQATTPFKEQA